MRDIYYIKENRENSKGKIQNCSYQLFILANEIQRLARVLIAFVEQPCWNRDFTASKNMSQNILIQFIKFLK